MLGVEKPVDPDEGAALLEGASFCCPACTPPKIPLEVSLPCVWPKVQPDPPTGLFDPPPNILLPPVPPPPPLPPKREVPPVVLVLNEFAAEDAGGWALDPNKPLAGVVAAVFVWPKRLLEAALAAGLPKGNGLLDFAGSDIVFEKGIAALELGNLDLRRGILGL